ncbi:MAG TPA: M28 family metallopeptidase [Chryseolinea sp.]|nr:M28 family metallopeptidase [Chryseolinea sp.]
MYKNLLFIPFVLFLTSTFGQINQEIQNALTSVDPVEVKATMAFLSDDLLEGRQPGTKGFALASHYIQTEFMSIGLKPGVGDSFIQRVPLVKGIVNSDESKFVLAGGASSESLTYGMDFILTPYMVNENSSVTAPLIFAGFGVSAPELGYDDYKEIDVKGKIVVLLDQAPETFGNNERAYFSSPAIKYQEAIKQGAVGVVNLGMSRRSSWEATVRRSAQGAFKWLDKQNHPSNAFEGLKVTATLNPSNADKLFKLSGKNIDAVYAAIKAGKPQSFSLKMSAQLNVSTQLSQVESSNLIGVIPGSDPKLKGEYIVYVAHLDHFGIGNPVKGDSIYNGAHDNASGVAILLGIAKAFQSLPVAPKRSIVIGVVTGEESGLLGSDYFVSNPTVDGTIVANLALDMPFFFHPILDIVPYGVQHSSLSNQVAEATKTLNLKVSPDPFPEQVIFVRSDHFSFIKKGIPALFIKSGFMTIPSDTVNRAKSDVAWRSTTYHTPQDDMRQAFDFTAAVTHVQVNFLIGFLIANEPSRPQWNKGDFFGNKFGKK